jgi:hypothetical protein
MGIEQHPHLHSGLTQFDEGRDDLIREVPFVSTRLSPTIGDPANASNDVRKAGSWISTEASVSGAGVEAQPQIHTVSKAMAHIRAGHPLRRPFSVGPNFPAVR